MVSGKKSVDLAALESPTLSLGYFFSFKRARHVGVKGTFFYASFHSDSPLNRFHLNVYEYSFNNQEMK